MHLTLGVECVNGVVYDAVGAETLCFGQQTQQRSDLQPHWVICFLEEDNIRCVLCFHLRHYRLCISTAEIFYYSFSETVFIKILSSSLPCSSAPTGSWPHLPHSLPPQACVQTAVGTVGHQWSWWPYRGQYAELQTYWVWTDAASWLELLHGESVNIQYNSL